MPTEYISSLQTDGHPTATGLVVMLFGISSLYLTNEVVFLHLS